MALFNIAGTVGVPPSVYEVPGKIYIFGQAHDAETLTPIFGDYLRGTTSSTLGYLTNSRAMVSLTHSSISQLNRSANIVPDDRARMLGGSTQIPMYSSITMPNGDYISIGASAGTACTVTRYTPEGEIKIATAISETQYGTELAFFHEDEMNAYAVGVRSSSDISYTVGNRYICCVNKNTLAVSPVAYGSLNSPYGSYGSTFMSVPLWKDADGAVYIINCVITANSSAAKQWTVTKITKGGIVSNSATAASIEFSGMGLVHGMFSSSGAKYLHDDADSIYFIQNSIQSSVAITAASNKVIFIGKISKQTLAVSRALEADAVVAVGDNVDMTQFANLFNGFFGGVASTYDIREVKRDSVSAYFMLTMVKQGTRSMTATMTGTSFSLILKISLASMGTQEVVEMFTHRANVGCSGVLALNQDNDQFMICYDNAGADFVQYSKASNKLYKRDQLEFPLCAAMVDQMGRIWAQDAATTSLHLFSPTISSTIRVGFTDRSLKFNGIPVDSTITVSAFNNMGARVANNVTLTLEGNSAVFADGSKTFTAMTLVNGDLFAPYTLISNGYVRVTAVVAV